MIQTTESNQYKPYLILFFGSLAFRLLIGLLYQQPGYTDAYYYANSAISLWEGRGFREDYIWIYLGRPLPESAFNNPSNTYWLPLTSVLIWFGYLFGGGPQNFLAAQLPIMLVSSLLPPLAYYFGKDVFGAQGKRYGWLLGILTIFCGIFALYFTLPDNFAPYALFSFLFLIFSYKALRLPPERKSASWKFMALCGLTAGLAYLTRVDGVILLVVPPLSLLGYRYLLREKSGLLWRSMLLMGLVFSLTISPWLIHNLIATGQLFPGGGTKTLFMREYNDFFSYNRELDLAYLLNLKDPSPTWGIGQLIGSRFEALLLNLLVVARITLFVFTPFFILGLFSRQVPDEALPVASLKKPGTLWRRAEMLPFIVYLILLYLAMSLAFTFPSTRGSLFHSSGGLVPFVLAFTIAGLDLTAKLVSRKNPKRAVNRANGYNGIMVVIIIIGTLFLGIAPAGTWDDTTYEQMKDIAAVLDQRGAKPTDVIMHPDAPAYYYVTRRPSISFSNESIETNLEIMRRYKAKYVVLVPDNTPASFKPMLDNKAYPGFEYLGSLDDIQFYKVKE
jgi:hypothetical protein